MGNKASLEGRGPVLLAWGAAENGQLGLSKGKKKVAQPQVIESLVDKRIVSVACGGNISVACSESGEAFVCGENMGEGEKRGNAMLYRPVRIEAKVIQVACGKSHVAVLDDCGTVHTWGSGKFGVLGHGDTADCLTPTPIAVLKEVISISSGIDHMAAIVKQKMLFTWGQGSEGQLGHGAQRGKGAFLLKIPMLVDRLEHRPVRMVACVFAHTVAVLENEEVVVWGRNEEGQLGLGNTTPVLAPTSLHSLSGQVILSVACGSGNTSFIAKSGDWLMCGVGGPLGPDKTTKVKKMEAWSEEGVHVVAQALYHNTGIIATNAQHVFEWDKTTGHNLTKCTALFDKDVSFVACGESHYAAIVGGPQQHESDEKKAKGKERVPDAPTDESPGPSQKPSSSRQDRAALLEEDERTTVKEDTKPTELEAKPIESSGAGAEESEEEERDSDRPADEVEANAESEGGKGKEVVHEDADADADDFL